MVYNLCKKYGFLSINSTKNGCFVSRNKRHYSQHIFGRKKRFKPIEATEAVEAVEAIEVENVAEVKKITYYIIPKYFLYSFEVIEVTEVMMADEVIEASEVIRVT